MTKAVDIDLLIPFENHPFKERIGIEQQELTESIKENGLLESIIVRPFPAGKYEIISGHRRVEACKALGITSIPVTIKELTKDEAIVQMVDSNIHREHILPSEKAFAYKMKSEALKHQGKTSCQLGTKLRTDEKIAETVNDSARQIQRYIRLTYLLENRQYTGCTVNGKSTTVSYKVHKKIEKCQDDYQIIPNTQEAIISENTWLRVQELRKNKRRNTATGRRSLFSGLVYCADCGSKLHFCASKSLKKNQEFWRCSSYKDGRGTCTIHFIRDVVLEAIVKETISELADFVRCYNNAFLYLISEKKGAESINREKSLRAKTESAKQRISDLDKLFSRIYEDNILGKLSDERYSRMANEYEAEQKRLISEVEENEKALIEL